MTAHFKNFVGGAWVDGAGLCRTSHSPPPDSTSPSSTAIITVASMSHRRRLERREYDAQVTQRHLLAEVQTMATIDWLTGLYNRRHFFRLDRKSTRLNSSH